MYDELDLEKGLFRGHVFLRVSLLVLKLLFLHDLVIFSGFAHNIYREILSFYQPSSSFETFPGGNAWHAESFPRSGRICRRPGKIIILSPV